MEIIEDQHEFSLYIEEEIIPEINIEADKFRSRDIYIYSYLVGLKNNLDSNAQLRNILIDSKNLHPHYEPSYIINKLLRTVQYIKLYTSPTDTDYPYQTPEEWDNLLSEISSQNNEAYDEVLGCMFTREINSTVSDRGISIAAIIEMAKDRIGEMPNVAEIGPGLNIILKRLALHHKKKRNLNQDYMYRWNINHVYARDLNYNIENTDISEDSEYTEKFRNLINRNYPFIGHGIGIDIWDAREQGNIRWASACSFYPSELINQQKIFLHSFLLEESSPNVFFYQQDFTKFNKVDYKNIQKLGVNTPFDLVFASTMTYQLSEKNRKVVLEKMRKIVKPNGLIVIQDFAERNPLNPSELVYYPNWFGRQWEYVTYVIDPSDPKSKFHEVFRFETARCKDAILGPAIKLNSTSGKLELDLTAD